MPADRFFSQTDLDAIKAAVQAAEGRTSGEIVPFVVDQSDEYASAVWKGAALGAILSAFGALALHLWSNVWGIPLDVWIGLPAPLGAAVGYLLSRVPPIRRWLVGEEVLESRTRRRAGAAFLDQEVFDTRDRTGILLFVSLFEHRVVLLADAGIDRVVEEGAWEGITSRLAREIRGGRPGPALVEAIQACGELLTRHAVERRVDDQNELRDDLRRERQ